MANKPMLKGLVASLHPKGAKPSVVELRQSNPGPMPLASLLEGAVPEPTQYELDLELRQSKGDPLPYYAKGKVEVLAEPPKLPVMTRQALNNAMAKAKQGKRLTLAERRLLGKHNLARIMVRLRPKGGDCG